MRINFAILLALFSTTLSLAGTPDQDPIVKERREKFIKARIPTLDDLKLGKTWQCILYNSFPGNFNHLGPAPLFRFSEFDGLVTNEIHFQNAVHSFQLTAENFTDSVTTSIPEDDYEEFSIVYFRVSGNGDLIFERVFYDDNPILIGAPRGISDNTKLVSQYGVCPANKIKD
ncbi:MAG: hypothetical protein ABIQ95_10505 [Bdellovibrionia bacterium]